jgi:hypothetical protein
LIPPLLMVTVLLDGLGVGGAILLPVVGMVDTPLSRAVATDLAILRIDSELPFTALTATLLLARLGRARCLLRMKSGRSELPSAETALPLIHPYKISSYLNALPALSE